MVTLVPCGIFSYLINLVAPVESATESLLALSGSLPAIVSIRMRLLFNQTVLFSSNTGFDVNSALPVWVCAQFWGGETAVSVVFDSGLVWSAFYKETCPPPFCPISI